MDDALRFPREPADLDELIELGVIQEANRRFFHVLGLELVTRLDPERGLVLEIDGGGCDQAGLAFGYHEEEWSEFRQERARRIDAIYTGALAARLEAFGYAIQPIADL